MGAKLMHLKLKHVNTIKVKMLIQDGKVQFLCHFTAQGCKQEM